jgi:hypothetical protein
MYLFHSFSGDEEFLWREKARLGAEISYIDTRKQTQRKGGREGEREREVLYAIYRRGLDKKKVSKLTKI